VRRSSSSTVAKAGYSVLFRLDKIKDGEQNDEMPDLINTDDHP
jgi:hypothetical protein